MVRDFLRDIAETYEGGWDELMRDAGVPHATAQAWRYKTPSNTPNAPALLRILQTAGVLEDAAARALERALKAARGAERDAQVVPIAQARPKKGGSRR